ncbi:unnamed protein product, partial [Mesorhabditis belari]|uniref:Uncharacterized protein n=1 Tax=Mesorhabditis belari TaxID=2138241 RepID=A0AAF3FI59_9BILA
MTDIYTERMMEESPSSLKTDDIFDKTRHFSNEVSINLHKLHSNPLYYSLHSIFNYKLHSNTSYYSLHRLLFLAFEIFYLVPILYVCTRVTHDTILYFVLACTLPILVYDLLKIVKNLLMFFPDYEEYIQPVYIQIDYFMHNLIHMTFVICTELYFLHSSMAKYKYEWIPFAVTTFFAAFLASCTCFIDSIITNLFIVFFTTITVSAMVIMGFWRRMKAKIEHRRYVPHNKSGDIALFSVYITTPYTLNGFQFLLSFVSILARAKADSASDSHLWDESVHAYASYLMQFRPLAIMSPIFWWIPHFRDHWFTILRRLRPKKLDELKAAVEKAKDDKRPHIRMVALAFHAFK